ncbi:electron transfer flavoprotein subunit beta/FixA family protein [Aeromonas schubertii]|uniref:Electron transfer flavoprotein subunit beta n=1 Tax=Aeromonas schubertii TaxID=652 RepID=A0A0S2SJN9_9GAMM|nr:electron transfer flavoprotein subunit beta/FixA family protein [Aeromonas schubertii]ALP41920.1 electron transporter RnfB [Aeromonas schubertii]KUE81377.1 electron transporter RnfB [Aeromonas schubertii]MBZ6065084.1 electron transfer flavoprotein subunit beta/FixA family protein [Aeromonas schubertii]
MKLLVPIKRVIDYNVKVRVKGDGSDVDLANVKMGINPFCEIAVEEAVRLREQGIAQEVVVVTLGPEAAAEQLRHALALGADRALHYVTDERLQPLAVARALARVCESEQPDLVLLGKQSIDSDNGQVPAMLGTLLEWPVALYASALKPEGGELLVTREVDGGLETVALGLPAVVSVDLRLNEPRFASLPNIMKAKRKPLESQPLATLGAGAGSAIVPLGVTPPPQRSGGVLVGSVDELLVKLKQEAKVIS